MRLAYLCTDELNQALVQGWARRRGIAIACPSRANRTLAGAFDAVLLDLDHLPPEGLPPLAGRGQDDGTSLPIAAHGYGVAADELRRRGIAVPSRLRTRLLQGLAQAALATARTPHDDGAADAPTWVELG